MGIAEKLGTMLHTAAENANNKRIVNRLNKTLDSPWTQEEFRQLSEDQKKIEITYAYTKQFKELKEKILNNDLNMYDEWRLKNDFQKNFFHESAYFYKPITFQKLPPEEQKKEMYAVMIKVTDKLIERGYDYIKKESKMPLSFERESEKEKINILNSLKDFEKQHKEELKQFYQNLLEREHYSEDRWNALDESAKILADQETINWENIEKGNETLEKQLADLKEESKESISLYIKDLEIDLDHQIEQINKEYELDNELEDNEIEEQEEDYEL